MQEYLLRPERRCEADNEAGSHSREAVGRAGAMRHCLQRGTVGRLERGLFWQKSSS